MKVPLGFDFDEDDTLAMLQVVWRLVSAFGDDAVFVRRSSSGRGWHVRVPDHVIPAEREIEIREKWGDCRGRCEADRARIDAGLKSSRLFGVKSHTTIRDGKVIRQKIIEADPWMSARQWIAEYGHREPWIGNRSP